MVINRRMVLWGLDGLLLLALAVYVVAGTTRVPFHGDESTLIAMSRDYHTLVQCRDLDAVLYTESPDDPAMQELRLLNGTVSKLAIGLAWDAAHLTVYDLNDQWMWGFDDPTGTWDEFTYNVAFGHMPDDHLLHVARLPPALLAVLSVWAVFGIARLVSAGRAAAWAASLVYATTPAVLLNGRRAMMEGALLAFSTLSVLAALLLIARLRSRARAWEQMDTQDESKRGIAAVPTSPLNPLSKYGEGTSSRGFPPLRVWRGGAGGEVKLSNDATREAFLNMFPAPGGRGPAALTLVFGVMSGLAVASKHPALITVGALFFALALDPWVRPGGDLRALLDRRHILRLAAAGGVALLVFLALNPAWWSDPLGMPDRVLALRRHLIDVQVQAVGGYDGPLDRVRGLADETFFAAPQYYELGYWHAFIGGEIADYEASGLAGRGTGALWGVLSVVASGAGMIALARRWREGPVWGVLAWIAVTALALLALTPMQWQRYYLPLQPPLAVIEGIGVVWIGAALVRWVQRRRVLSGRENA